MGPYSMDLRERVAAVIDEGQGSQLQVAKRFPRHWSRSSPDLLQRRRYAGTLAPIAPLRRFAAGRRFRRTGTAGDADLRSSRCHLDRIEGVGQLRLYLDDQLAHPPLFPPDLQELDPRRQ